MKQKSVAAFVALACLFAGHTERPGTAAGGLHAECAQYPGSAVSVHLPGQARDVPGLCARRPEGARAARTGLRHEQGSRRPVVRHDDATQVEGFHYYTLSIDGAVVADPATRTFFGSGFYNSAIEVPDADADYYTLKDVPRGQIRQQWYHSKVTGAWRRAYVYTPPDYDANTKTKYPVLVPAARLGRKRARVVHPGSGRRHHGQSHCGEEGETHDHRHGQPECGQAR